MILFDAFSGIGGFHLGLERAGFKFKKVYYSEINKYSIANYRKNYPEAVPAGPIEDCSGIGGERIDVFTFGSPCQGFSVAGEGEGLGHEESGKIIHALEFIKKHKPGLFIWENVKGALSGTHRGAFIGVLKFIAELGCYDCQWQLVNTRWVLPQNRERIFLIGHLTETGGSFGKVFPVRESDFENGQKNIQQSKNYAGTIKGKNNSGQLSMDSGTTLIQIGQISDSNNQASRVYDPAGLSKTLSDGGGQGAKTGLYMVGYVDKNSQGNRVYDEKGISTTISGASGGLGPNTGIYKINRNIRRLTEIECERLQGFPDDWTRYGLFEAANGFVEKEISATQRYKMLGNAVTVDIIEMIGRRLLKK